MSFPISAALLDAIVLSVVALAGTPDSVCAAVLRFREGRLTDKREFLFHDTSDICLLCTSYCYSSFSF